jgi:hypothetical protein
MLSVNLVIILYFTLCLVLILFLNEMDHIFAMFEINTTCRGNFVF